MAATPNPIIVVVSMNPPNWSTRVYHSADAPHPQGSLEMAPHRSRLPNTGFENPDVLDHRWPKDRHVQSRKEKEDQRKHQLDADLPGLLFRSLPALDSRGLGVGPERLRHAGAK